jgi:hypothetical protein
LEQAKDQDFWVSFGLIVSVRLSDVEKIRRTVEEAGGKVVFQTTTTAPLYLLRQYQIEKALQGDVSQLQEIHEKKRRRMEK